MIFKWKRTRYIAAMAEIFYSVISMAYCDLSGEAAMLIAIESMQSIQRYALKAESYWSKRFVGEGQQLIQEIISAAVALYRDRKSPYAADTLERLRGTHLDYRTFNILTLDVQAVYLAVLKTKRLQNGSLDTL